MPYRNHDSRTSERGFSLIELLIAMTVTLVVAGLASTLLAASLNMRTREDARTDSIADVQNALNTISREIAIGGYGFDINGNGLVVGDSDEASIRVRSNLDRYSANSTTTTELDEDVKYFVDSIDGQNFLVRYDKNAPAGTQATVLANRLDTLSITYWSVTNSELDVAAVPSQVANAVALTITVSTLLPAIGVHGSPGHQPETTIELSSNVVLRNKQENLSSY